MDLYYNNNELNEIGLPYAYSFNNSTFDVNDILMLREQYCKRFQCFISHAYINQSYQGPRFILLYSENPHLKSCSKCARCFNDMLSILELIMCSLMGLIAPFKLKTAATVYSTFIENNSYYLYQYNSDEHLLDDYIESGLIKISGNIIGFECVDDSVIQVNLNPDLIKFHNLKSNLKKCCFNNNGRNLCDNCINIDFQAKNLVYDLKTKINTAYSTMMNISYHDIVTVKYLSFKFNLNLI